MRGVILALVALAMVVLNTVSPNLSPAAGSTSSPKSSLTSSWYWIQGYGAWLRKDEVALIDFYSTATALNPHYLPYWRLAAQTIAFDLPAWKGGEGKKAYGQKALDFFERSRPYFTNDPEWFQTGAFLAESGMGSQNLALQYLEAGIQLPYFPYLLGKRYTRLLTESGRLAEALSFLKSWHPQLKDATYPEREIEVADWILSLEKQLNSPHSQ